MVNKDYHIGPIPRLQPFSRNPFKSIFLVINSVARLSLIRIRRNIQLAPKPCSRKVWVCLLHNPIHLVPIPAEIFTDRVSRT